MASIFPIAGTFKRSGDDEKDAEIARALENDPKESAEHVMLVDLARNDLSRHCTQVEVKAFKEVQYYSHLIHLVSHVSGKLREGVSSFKVVGDTTLPVRSAALQNTERWRLLTRTRTLNAVFTAALLVIWVSMAILTCHYDPLFLSKNNVLHLPSRRRYSGRLGTGKRAERSKQQNCSPAQSAGAGARVIKPSPPAP